MKGKNQDIPDDPEFDHYVIEEGYLIGGYLIGGYLIGEAKEVRPDIEGISFGYVKLWGMEEFAEYGSIENRNLVSKKMLMKYLGLPE
jgi:hypothetical protein